MSDIPNVTIGVLVYNHEKYIRACLNSLVNQIGNFNLKIIIHDDCSTDNSEAVIKEFMAAQPQSERIKIHYHRHLKNLGMNGVRNLGSLVAAMKGSDYFSLIDGDDLYSSFLRIALHLQLHKQNSEICLSYNLLQFFLDSDLEYPDFIPECNKEFPDTEDLIQENFIGNLGCAFYNSEFLNQLPEALFELPCYDWFFNTYYSQFGKIARLDKFLNLYRKHNQGIWSQLGDLRANQIMIEYIAEYNRFFDYRYDRVYSMRRQAFLSDQNFDLLIIDDFFPSPHSGFRLQELTSIMEALPGSRVYCRGLGTSFFGKETADDLVQAFKVKNSHLDNQLQTVPFMKGKAKLMYINFISTAYCLLVIDNYQLPFVLTVYPGGGFALNSPEVDARMRLIFESPYFRKVIVTQQVTYDYLVNNGFCNKEQIEFVFGVVTPLAALEKQYPDKKHYKFDKESLDICFVAHKYTERGQDKGYDTFIAAAHQLAQKYKDINFHVVGPWNREIIDVSELGDRISFYGPQDQDWFDEFYLDKDIILSPNIPDQIYAGSFDGFPTGCATDAALREVAIFCTDPLNLNQDRFILDTDIVIIKPEAEQIVGEIIKYYEKPQELREIARNGARKIKQLYSYQAQIAPRIRILEEEMLKGTEYYSTMPVERPASQPAAPATFYPYLRLDKKIARKTKTAAKLIYEGKFSELYQKFNFNVEKVINRHFPGANWGHKD